MKQQDDTPTVTDLTRRWTRPGIPHKGWTCESITDLGFPSATCEMCETQEIRWIHWMRHPDFDGLLGAGCICAGHMENDLKNAKNREQRLKAEVRQREKAHQQWIDPDKWKVSRTGNYHRDFKGYNLGVFRRGDLWKVRASRNQQTLFHPGQYDTAVEAFEYLWTVTNQGKPSQISHQSN